MNAYSQAVIDIRHDIDPVIPASQRRNWNDTCGRSIQTVQFNLDRAALISARHMNSDTSRAGSKINSFIRGIGIVMDSVQISELGMFAKSFAAVIISGLQFGIGVSFRRIRGRKLNPV